MCRLASSWKLQKNCYNKILLGQICNGEARNFDTDCINLNYSRNSIWTANCTMNLKINPCSHNTTQLTHQKGIKSFWDDFE